MKKTGEKTQAPRKAPTIITVNKVKIQLTQEEQREFQKLLGEQVIKSLDKFGESKTFKNMPEKVQIDKIVQMLNNRADMVRQKMIGKLIKSGRYKETVKEQQEGKDR